MMSLLSYPRRFSSLETSIQSANQALDEILVRMTMKKASVDRGEAERIVRTKVDEAVAKELQVLEVIHAD